MKSKAYSTSYFFLLS